MAVGFAASPAFAENAMQVCGAKYQAAKKANTLPAGQTWNQFLAACRASMPKPATAAVAPVKPAPTMVALKPAKATKPRGEPSAAQKAMYAREKQCGVQWRADKAAGKVAAGMKWPQYWSACNKRMK
ncbi:MAG: hypothetical protein E7773_15060 [Sphingomonas sp.]|nr:MAG: hypothetical protein E7773_15060 [Sphingomonas sp.]